MNSFSKSSKARCWPGDNFHKLVQWGVGHNILLSSPLPGLQLIVVLVSLDRSEWLLAMVQWNQQN